MVQHIKEVNQSIIFRKKGDRSGVEKRREDA